MKSIKLLFSALLLSFSISCLGGCANNDATDAKQERQIVDLAGDEVILPEKIEKIASTSNPCSNMLIAFGQGDKLVGSYRTIFDNPWFSKFYPRANDITSFKSYCPEAESLYALGVDLIFVPTKDWADELRNKGICAVCIRFYDPSEIKQSVNLLGDIFGGETKAKANKWLNLFDSTVETIGEKIKDIPLEERPVLYEIIGDKYRGLFRTNYGLGQAWLEYGGGIIATKEFGDYSSGVKPTEEAILAKNPDVIFIGGTYASKLEKDLYADPKWAEINAVVNKEVYLAPVGACYWNDCSVEYPLMINYVFSCIHKDLVDFDMSSMAHDFYLEYYGVDFNENDMSNMMQALNPSGKPIVE